LDSLRQFCAVLLCGDENSGADFSDLPDMNGRKDKGEIEGKFELSPYFHSCRIPNFWNQWDCHTLTTCANLYHPVPHATSNGNIHCQVSDYVFLCGKRNNSSPKRWNGNHGT
jgi:hypothetical protein